MNRALLIVLVLLPLMLGADAPEAEPEPTPRAEPPPWERPRAEEGGCSDEEILVLRDLRKRARELDRRDAELDERAAALADLETGTAADLEHLQAMRDAVIELMTQQRAGAQERIASLARVVDTMKAPQAASMLAGMDPDVALQVLRKIKPKQAGKVLGAMPARTAQELGDRMTRVPDPREES